MTTIKSIKQQIEQVSEKTIDQIKSKYALQYDLRTKAAWRSILELETENAVQNYPEESVQIDIDEDDEVPPEDMPDFGVECEGIHISKYLPNWELNTDNIPDEEFEIAQELSRTLAELKSKGEEIDKCFLEYLETNPAGTLIIDTCATEIIDEFDSIERVDKAIADEIAAEQNIQLADDDESDDNGDDDLDLDELLDGYMRNEPLQRPGFIAEICTRITEEYNYNKFVFSDLWSRGKQLLESRREVTKKIRHTCLDRFEFLPV